MGLNIDVKLIQDNLVELLTNTINVSSLFAKIFYDPVPEEVDLTQWVYNESSDKITTKVTKVPNVAFIKDELASRVGKKTMILTQEQYEAIQDKDPNVLYFIVGDLAASEGLNLDSSSTEGTSGTVDSGSTSGSGTVDSGSTSGNTDSGDSGNTGGGTAEGTATPL